MPIHQDLADLAREVINWKDAIPDARQEMLQARVSADAAKTAFPPEVAEAYEVLAEEAVQTLADTERAFEEAKARFMAARRGQP